MQSGGSHFTDGETEAQNDCMSPEIILVINDRVRDAFGPQR